MPSLYNLLGFRVTMATALALPLALAGCGNSGTAAPVRSQSSTNTAASPATAFTGMVDIGGGRKVLATCAGSGSPTVILESGDESDHRQWALVAPAVAKSTRTCSYDRLGNGASDEATGCRGLKDLRADLEALLQAMGEDAPYVLVGTSGGGFLMAGFAYAHAEDVRGMVLVETPKAIVKEAVPARLLADLRCDNPANVERRDYVKVENEAWNGRRPVGDIPLTVITNDYGDNYENEEMRTNVQGQKGWLKLSPQGRQVVVTSGHNVAMNEADLVIKEVLRVVDAAKRR